MEFVIAKYTTPQVGGNLQAKVDEAFGIISMYSDGRFIRALFSGGKDSIVSTHIAAHHPAFMGVSHVRTGTGPDAEKHSNKVQTIATASEWHYMEASPTITYEMMVHEHGFPGPSEHHWMYDYLKAASIAKLTKQARKHAHKQAFSYITGIRRAESQQRADAPERKIKSKSEWWLSPLISWTLNDVFEYMDFFNLAANVGESGECHCGSFGNELVREQVIARTPEQGVYWDYLEQSVTLSRQRQLYEVSINLRDEKKVIKEHHCRWGHGRASGKVTQSEAVSICSTCAGSLDADGNVGTDPDAMLAAAKARIQKINDDLKSQEAA